MGGGHSGQRKVSLYGLNGVRTTSLKHMNLQAGQKKAVLSVKSRCPDEAGVRRFRLPLDKNGERKKSYKFGRTVKPVTQYLFSAVTKCYACPT